MKIFISWSGRPAREMAKFLQVWLVKVIQALEPFMSDDIEMGARWDAEIASQLEGTGEGIVVVTSRNQTSPWLNFEAGALAKTTDASRVRPLLIDLTPTDISGPISRFQATPAADKAKVFKMLKEINNRCKRPIPDHILEPTFDLQWPEFESKLNKVIELEKSRAAPPKRTDSDILAEILDLVRAIDQEERRQFDSHADLRSREALRRSRDAERKGLKQSELEAEEAARPLVGRVVQTDTFEEKGSIRGEVVSTLTRGTGIYARITDADGATHTVPLSLIRDIEGEK